MKNRNTIAAGAILLLAGVIAAYLINRLPPATSTTGGTATPAAAGTAANSSSGAGDAANPAGPATRARVRDEVKHKDLAAQYGESRTNLAKHISGNVIGLLETANELGEIAMGGETGGPFGSTSGMRMSLGSLGNDLKLTDEQQAKATASYVAFRKRELERSKANLTKLRNDPTSLMKLMLASDASARGTVSAADYKQQQTATAGELQGVLNPLDERNFRGGKPLKDEAFLTDLKTVLDPAQTETLNASLAEQAAQPAADPNEGNISNIPKMELEKLDQTVESAQKFTTGLKGVMEGMIGMKDLKPMMEKQRKDNESTP